MARMKFLCDADRCIECNACVTACKNEHEVPWGINRRRVVTINDGKPGERSVSMACMHCTDAPCAAVCPVNCFYTTADAVVLHSKDLCIGCGYCFYACPFGAPQYPKVGNFGSRGKMDKCTFCAGGPEADGSQGRVREVRRQPSRRGQAAALRRDVLDQVAARRRRRDHRADLQGARGQARLRLRRLGLEDGLQRDHRDLMRSRGGAAATLRRPHRSVGRDKNKEDVAWRDCLHRLVSSSARWRSCSSSRWRRRRRRSSRRSVNPTASSVKEEQLLKQLQPDHQRPRARIPDQKSGNLIAAGRPRLAPVPRGDAALDRRHRHPRHAGAAGRLLSDARHGEDRERPLGPHASCASTRSSASCTG